MNGELNCEIEILGERPYQCDECSADFKYRNNWKQHMKIHTGEKMFKCSKCDASFIQKNSLIIHVRIHTKEKPFSCEVCFASFKHAHSLKTHLRTHTGKSIESFKNKMKTNFFAFVMLF